MRPRPIDCSHPERVEGVCASCGHCLHEVVLNGACFYCGSTELDPHALSPKAAADFVSVKRLGKRREEP